MINNRLHIIIESKLQKGAVRILFRLEQLLFEKYIKSGEIKKIIGLARNLPYAIDFSRRL